MLIDKFFNSLGLSFPQELGKKFAMAQYYPNKH